MPKKTTKPNRKPSKPSSKPFTVVIHGEGIDIDATIANTKDETDFGRVITALADKLSSRIGGGPGPTTASTSKSDVQNAPIKPFSEYVDDLVTTFTDEQLSTARDAIEHEQKKRAEAVDDAETQH